MNMIDFVKRPGLGRKGRVINVRANYIEISYLPYTNIYHYDVIITPEVPPSLNRRIYCELESLQADVFERSKPVFDGRRNIFTAIPLPFEAATFDITLSIDITPLGERPPCSFNIKVRKVAVINMEILHRFLEGKCSSSSMNILPGIMALNVLIHYKPSIMHVTHNDDEIIYAKYKRSFYTNQISQPLYGGAEVWQRYYQSIKPTSKKLMVNIEVSGTAFYENCSLIQMVVKLLVKRHPDDLRRGIPDRDRVKLERALKNIKIRVTHLGSASKRLFKIVKLTNTPASGTKLEIDGKCTDVASYFQVTYKKPLLYPFLPCVIVRKDTSIPLEGQRHFRKLNERQTADMFKLICPQPQVRANKILQGSEILNHQDNERLRRFGMHISDEMAVVVARILPAPRLQYHPSSRDASFVPKDGSWNMRDKKVATGATLGSWAVVSFGRYELEAVQNFIRELVNTCFDIGMNIPNKSPTIQQGNPMGNIEQILRQAWVKAGNMSKSPPQLIVCVLPNTGVPLYAEIKRVSDTVIGVATQCVQSKHVYQAKKQYCANVCLKMNVKLGGMNSFIEPSLVPFITKRPTMIMGADITHPAPGGDSSRPSIAALCASMDAKASRYATSIRIQGGMVLIIADLIGMVKELLKTFYQTCGRKPECILFYRDGISDSQFEQVIDFEVSAIKAACLALESNYKPTITYIVVQKRHHTRFFPMNKEDSDRTGNCLPGTVVESTITHPFEFDFYLTSHSSSVGTSRSTHYHVLYDENQFTSDSLQTLSYNLCYTFARSTRAVSIVTPVYYAHLACNRARFHFRGENWSDIDSETGGSVSTYGMVKPELQSVMYFI